MNTDQLMIVIARLVLSGLSSTNASFDRDERDECLVVKNRQNQSTNSNSKIISIPQEVLLQPSKLNLSYL